MWPNDKGRRSSLHTQQARPFVLALTALLILLPAVSPAVPAAEGSASGPLLIGVMGDIGVTPRAANSVNALAAAGAGAFLGLGDYAYWSPVSDWAAQMKPMLDLPHHLVLGNHDEPADYAPYVGHTGTEFSVVMGGARVVGLDTQRRYDVGSPGYAWLDRELARPEAVKILIMHKAWWLGPEARHPGAEFPGDPLAMDALVEKHRVSIVMAGHEHNYQRANRAGATYLINGAGGQSLYPVQGASPGTVATSVAYGHVRLSVTANGIQGAYADEHGAILDSFTLTPEKRTTGGTFSATFSGVKGNEWWVEASVSATQPLAGVSARIEGGEWRALEKKSWGSWARSFHAPAGSRVEFRATSTDGATALSGKYSWPDATRVAEPPKPSFTATFSGVKGNEWWVEANVKATETVSGVEARVDGGPWRALEKKAWGSWARSFHVPAGSLVQLRAVSATGGESLSGSYRWPDATPANPPETFPAKWGCISGNTWWEQACVSGGSGIARVDVGINGVWHPLDNQGWGWGVSKYAPHGSKVQFRATDTAGKVALSAVYTWPVA